MRTADEDAGAVAFVVAQHKAAKVCQVVLVAAMALATQLALVTPSVMEFLAAPATWLIQEAPALQESQVVQLVPFHRSRGHPKHEYKTWRSFLSLISPGHLALTLELDVREMTNCVN